MSEAPAAPVESAEENDRSQRTTPKEKSVGLEAPPLEQEVRERVREMYEAVAANLRYELHAFDVQLTEPTENFPALLRPVCTQAQRERIPAEEILTCRSCGSRCKDLQALKKHYSNAV